MIKDIPSGLLTCFINENEYGIASLDEKSVTVRMAENPDFCVADICFCYYLFESAQYKELCIKDAHVTRKIMKSDSFLVIFGIDQLAYTQMLYFVINQYQKYIRLKSESYDNSFSEELTGYPSCLDDTYEEDYDIWKDNRIEKHHNGLFQKIDSLCDVTISFQLQMPQEYEMYLTGEIEKNIPAVILRKSSRIYLGNAYCPLLFPKQDILWKITEQAYLEGLAITLVFPVLQESFIPFWEKTISQIYEKCIRKKWKMEAVINDFGFLQFFSEKEDVFCISLGTLLNKRRKDARYPYKAGYEKQKSMLLENAMNCDNWLSFLKKEGIRRFEYETCGYEMKIASFGCSLHIPMFQTNTSQFCTMHALIVNKNRGKQKLITDCPYYCQRYVAMYPGHLSAIGKMNSMFAWDTWLNEHPEILDNYVKQGVDRIVWNLI